MHGYKTPVSCFSIRSPSIPSCVNQIDSRSVPLLATSGSSPGLPTCSSASILGASIDVLPAPTSHGYPSLSPGLFLGHAEEVNPCPSTSVPLPLLGPSCWGPLPTLLLERGCICFSLISPCQQLVQIKSARPSRCLSSTSYSLGFPKQPWPK